MDSEALKIIGYELKYCVDEGSAPVFGEDPV